MVLNEVGVRNGVGYFGALRARLPLALVTSEALGSPYALPVVEEVRQLSRMNAKGVDQSIHYHLVLCGAVIRLYVSSSIHSS